MSSIAACPFCNLGERILLNNRHAFAFLSNPRKMPGHFLVTPKRHVEKPWELTSEELLAIFDLITTIQRRIVPKFAAGCDVRQNYRPFLKQGRTKVDHVHYHVMPRDFEDELYHQVEKHETPLFQDLGDKEAERMQRLLQ